MSRTPDPFDLERFVAAQHDTYAVALGELQAGAKRSHWMWFIFPQVAGLGSSPMAVRYAIRSKSEAAAYLAHPVLGPRLEACARALLGVAGKSAEDIMGHPDYLKLKSSLTLFAALSAPDSIFAQTLEKYYNNERDRPTLDFLARN